MKKCLACGNERDLDDGNSPDSCPGCGRYYAKVEAAIRAHAEARHADPQSGQQSTPGTNTPRDSTAQPSSYRQNSSPQRQLDEQDEHEPSQNKIKSFWLSLGETKRIIVCVAAALVIGYFAGREHIKYEIGEAFRGAAKNFSGVFSGSNETPRKPSEPLKPNAKTTPREEPVSAALTKKGFFNGKYGQDAVTFDVRFENKTDKDIRGFNGVIIITDILDNVIKRLNVSITDPISAKASITWSGSMDYNQFIDSDRALRNAEFSDILASFKTTKVLFQDGETIELD